ncbi:phage tail tube protein [Stenotrophomonas maltophilia]|uniref:phage tail tube protein n=1 Tax=Stenotrophomonas maltophilia TaxID=40324 RepID=UPI0039C09B8F
MTEGVIKTQGSELFTVDKLSSSVASVLKFECPTGITGLGGAADQIESTCLDTKGDKEYEGGLGNPGQVSVPFNFIPRSGSHQILFDLKESREVLPWLIGLSDGVSPPTLDSDEELVAPASPRRTSIGFRGYVSDLNIDIATNEIVRGTLTIQRSGSVVPHWNGPYSA